VDIGLFRSPDLGNYSIYQNYAIAPKPNFELFLISFAAFFAAQKFFHEKTVENWCNIGDMMESIKVSISPSKLSL